MKVLENLLNKLPQPKDTSQSRQGESQSAREVEMWLLFEQLWEDLYRNAEDAPSSSRQGGSQSAAPEDKMWMQLEQLWEDLCRNPEQPEDGLS